MAAFFIMAINQLLDSQLCIRSKIMIERKVSVNLTQSSSTALLTFAIPNQCPHCGGIMTPDVVYAKTLSNLPRGEYRVGIFLRCTNTDCLKYYTLEYNVNTAYQIITYDRLIKYTYQPPIIDEFPREVSEVSPTFKKVYDQALKAEQLGLDQISGIGFRKSVEFLIKDYLIKLKSEPEVDVKSEFLGKSINRIELTSLKDLTKAATWIGNDETHYVRVWKDKDITDMKAFIRAAVLYISAEYQAAAAHEMVKK
ncbi:DUF4145 domain-containing protein [Lactiplantibacillus plantarum]|nr:DUF4145 domain-containing protein [Lactiplantibacillus plantarum]QAT34048.1 DUF4145 domain-containing protein [Lactiplantibacillus plantarum]